MSEFNDPAQPCSAMIFKDDGTWKYTGLTIRQQAVLMMAQGLCANVAMVDKSVSALAIEIADAVLKAERESRT